MLPFLSLFECPLLFHLLVLNSILYSFLIILCHISCLFIIYMTYGNPTISLLPYLLLVIFIIILVFFIFNKHIYYPKSLWKIKMVMRIFILVDNAVVCSFPQQDALQLDPWFYLLVLRLLLQLFSF